MSDEINNPDDLNNPSTNGNEKNDDKSGSGRRHYRKDNKRIANLKNVKSQKQEKLKRLIDERDAKKADLERSYLIVSLDNGSNEERVKHIPLDSSDKEMIRSVIAERELEIFELGLDIDEIDLKIRELAAVKKSSFREKLSKKKQTKKEDNLVKRVSKELDEAAKDGSNETVNIIKEQIQSGKKNEAFKSLKSFLSEKVKTVAGRLDKSEELEKNVLTRVIEELELEKL